MQVSIEERVVDWYFVCLQKLVLDFLFPASKLMAELKTKASESLIHDI